MLKKVFLNTGAQIVGKAITATSTLILTILVGKSLGPVGYGDFVKIFTFVGYFYIFSDFGLNAAYIKLSQNTKENSLISALFGLRLFGALALALVAIFVSFFLPYNLQTATGYSPAVKLGIAIASLTIVSQAILTTLNAYLQKNLRYDLSAVATVFGTLSTLAITVTIVLTHSNLLQFVSAYTIGGLITITAAWFLIKKILNAKPTPNFNWSKSKQLLIYAWPVGVALIFNLIYFRLDVFILSYTRPPQEVGIYGLAYQFFEASLAVPIFFANSLFPLLTGVFAKSKEDYTKEVKKWAFILFAISILATLALVLASFIIPVIFGKFQGAQTALIVLSLGLPFFFLSALLWHMLIIAGRQKLLIPIYFAGGVINVALNLILIPRFGYIAAAANTVFCEGLITLFLLIAQKTKHDTGEL